MRRRALLSAVGTAAFGLPLAGVRVDGERPTLEPLARVPIRKAADVNVDAAGETAYVTTQTGLRVVDVSDPEAPVVLAERQPLLADHANGPLNYVRDATVDGDRLLVTAHILGSMDSGKSAVLLFDVSDPANPQRVAVHETTYPVHNGDVRGDVAVITASETDRWPMVVLDAADGLSELARWSVLDGAPEWEQVHRSIRRLHDVHLRGDTAYLAYWDAGAWIVDLSDPASPEPVRQLGGRNPATVAASGNRAIVETLKLPGNVTAVRPNGDGSLIAWSKEGDGSTTRDVDRNYAGGFDVWHADGERAVTIAPPDVTVAETRWSKNFGWRDDRCYVAFRDAGVRAFDLANPTEPMLLAEFANPNDDDFHSARPIASGFVGLTFRGDPDSDPTNHLYTFPEPAGDGAVPARTRAVGPVTTTTGTAVEIETSTPTPPRTSERPSTTTMERSSTTSPERSTETTDQGTTGPPNSTPTPGFDVSDVVTAGVLGSLAAGAISAWRRGNRRDSD